MPKKNPFAKLPAEMQSKLIAAQRMIPGYWSTAELTATLGLSRNAIFMRVKRGRLVSVAKKPGDKLMFTDQAVADYVLNAPKQGRPYGRRQPKDGGTWIEKFAKQQAENAN